MPICSGITAPGAGLACTFCGRSQRKVRKLVAGNAALGKLADSHLVGLIEPEDIAAMALFLASDESGKVTGQVYPVDSGATIA